MAVAGRLRGARTTLMAVVDTKWIMGSSRSGNLDIIGDDLQQVILRTKWSYFSEGQSSFVLIPEKDEPTLVSPGQVRISHRESILMLGRDFEF